MEKFIKCTNGVRFRNVPEKLFNSPSFKRTEWTRVVEVVAPPVVKQTKAKKVEVIEDSSGLLEEFEILPVTNETFQNL